MSAIPLRDTVAAASPQCTTLDALELEETLARVTKLRHVERTILELLRMTDDDCDLESSDILMQALSAASNFAMRRALLDQGGFLELAQAAFDDAEAEATG